METRQERTKKDLNRLLFWAGVSIIVLFILSLIIANAFFSVLGE